MKTLIQHIENLLPDHDCVVVPGLGGFVQNEVPARFDTESDSFYPAGKEICFNARLTFNDGFLAQAYQESFGLSFEESNLQIRQGVQEIKDKIDEGKYISLGRIGVLWKNDNGQIIFRSENKNFFFPESYGLTSFTFPGIEKRQLHKSNTERQVRKRKEDEFINIRLHRNSFRNFVTGVAACLFMLLLAKPAGNLPETNNQEAFMMHDYLVSSSVARHTTEDVAEPTFIDTASTVDYDANRLVTSKITVKKQEDEKNIDPKTEIVASVNKTPAEVHVKKTVSARTYYIVVSSFPQKKLAEEWIQTNGQRSVFKFSGIIEKDGRSRVYSRSFPDKDVAQAYLDQFRASNPEYASAWLLSVKNS